jgi:hypothetical protein
MRRGPVKTFGWLGWSLAILGALLVGNESSNHSACNGFLGGLAQGLSASAQNSCSADNALYGIGLIFIVVGVVLIVGWVVLLVRNSTGGVPQPVGPANARPPTPTTAPPPPDQSQRIPDPEPGWYPVPGQQGVVRYWDGTAWRPEAPR